MFKGGFPIGKFFGIQLKLHYSWFFIFALVTYVLAGLYFPSTYPNWSLAMKIGAGLVTSLLYFSSVVIHEMSHSLVAIRKGIKIKDITLFFLGGVSSMESEPKRAGDEFKMAIAGPLSSLILGGIFLGIFFGLRGSSNITQQFVTAVAYYIGYINIFLGVFNLIPGFPLDGGRVFRSIIWAVTKDLTRATKIATYIGRGFGYLFIAYGVFQIFTNNFANGIWLAVIGWFLESAATGSYSQLVIQDTLKGHTAREIMSDSCQVTSPALPVGTFVNDVMLKSSQRCFPIGTDDRSEGLITLSDIKRIPQSEWDMTSVALAMTPFDQVKAVTPDADLRRVLQILAENNINQVPVVEGHRFVGMIARDSLINFIHVRNQLSK
jgi:Zn-dependent protease/CBS domain-containing protein